ncbi:MAG: hypothetical protein K0R34_344 [Herbinix sp.]|nr:hypothetical protein [Herbinix sp.]
MKKWLSIVLAIIFVLLTWSGSALAAGNNEKISSKSVKIVKVYAGSQTFGAIDKNGKVYMWGANYYGQCDVPKDLPPIVELGIGCFHVVALDKNGVLHGWGKQNDGELDFPEDLPRMISVTAKGYQTTALSKSGKVYKWGNTNGGSQDKVPADLSEAKVVQISNGTYYASALTESGYIYTWGIGYYEPVKADVNMLAPLAYRTVYLGNDGKVYGEVPHSNIMYRYKSQPKLPYINKLFGGDNNLAAIDADGKLYVWGEYEYKAEGGTFVEIPTNLPAITSAALGDDSIVCLGTNGKLYQWGSNPDYYGEGMPDQLNGFKDKPPVFKAVKPIDCSKPYEVYNDTDFVDAISLPYQTIEIKGDINITGDCVNIDKQKTLIIHSGATVTVSTSNFNIYGLIINKGKIIVSGRISFHKESPEIGDIKIAENSSRGEIGYYLGSVDVGLIKKYLSPDSIYTSLSVTPGDKTIIMIDKNVTIPQGKSLWLNSYCTLKVKKGVTLTINGEVVTFNQPVILGKVTGEIDELR